MVGSVPVAWWFGGLTVPHVMVAGFLAQSLFTFFDGANFGALPVLVGRDRVGEANSAVGGVGGSGSLKSGDPDRRAKASVEATTHYEDAKILAG